MRKLVLGILLLIIPARAYAGDTADAPLFPLHSSTKVLTTYTRTGKIRSTFVMDFSSVDVRGNHIYKSRADGEGAFYKFQHAKWTITSEMISDGKFVKPLRTHCVITDLTKQTTVTKETYFNYKTGKITMTSKEQNQKKPSIFTFPIKGITADYATLNYFLKPFIAHLSEENHPSFYLLTIEPRMYKVNLKFAKSEEVNLPTGKKSATKIRLIADFGILDEVMDKFVPPTFLWYEDRAPYDWLKYQGMETGLNSPYVTTSVTDSDAQQIK